MITKKQAAITREIDKLDTTKIKNFYLGKDTLKRMKIRATKWEKILSKLHI